MKLKTEMRKRPPQGISRSPAHGWWHSVAGAAVRPLPFALAQFAAVSQKHWFPFSVPATPMPWS